MKDLIPIDIYKDPLRKNEGGYGYLGCVLQTREEDKLQCHVCGQLFESLGNHVRQKHKLKAKEYRLKFQLCSNTSLNSRDLTQKLRNNMLQLPKEIKEKRLKHLIENRGKGNRKGTKMSLEERNRRGSCPDQILEEIKRFTQEKGHPPSQPEFKQWNPMGHRYIRLAERTFGSWNDALRKISLEPQKATGRKGDYVNWDDESLKELLVNFTLEHKRVPRSSDLELGDLPHYSTYVRRFGSLEEARKIAGVYDLV